ncbi:hypothetical protein JSQ81_17390 [Sporosarcina sp. Marseille-Q4063]|uniref:hypothetical protein n=1 Tax=Sporosarcina sp. Marseille-Q4063 TaxID=2810514 RepID=UPI001BAF3FFF|nr:hypothetical protein [Sporosarcina sp. Marseille-Q4063]QUW21547.1 hypothetical protein JSQ81_17390 [Sporosarcina sp. Marseille-Q4063]
MIVVEGGDSRGKKRDSRDPGQSVAKEAARRSPAGKRPPATEINGSSITDYLKNEHSSNRFLFYLKKPIQI